jgi:hypothetical protein
LCIVHSLLSITIVPKVRAKAKHARIQQAPFAGHANRNANIAKARHTIFGASALLVESEEDGRTTMLETEAAGEVPGSIELPALALVLVLGGPSTSATTSL